MSPMNPEQYAQRQVRWAQLAIWLVPLLWSVNYIVARRAPGVVEPYTLALGRWGLAGLMLASVSWREIWTHNANLRAVWVQYVVLGFCGMLVCGAWVYIGARTTPAVNIALIYSASPVLIALGAVSFLGERLRLTHVLGGLLALAGVLHVIVRGQWMALASVQWVVGDAWIVGAMVAWAAYALLQKLWPSPLGPTARLACMCAGGVAVLLPCAAWEAMQGATPSWSWAASGLVLAAALAPGLAAYWLYSWAQRVFGASRVAVTLYLGPLYAALVAWGVLGESLGWHHLLGAALILPGVFLVSRS